MIGAYSQKNFETGKPWLITGITYAPGFSSDLAFPFGYKKENNVLLLTGIIVSAGLQPTGTIGLTLPAGYRVSRSTTHNIVSTSSTGGGNFIKLFTNGSIEIWENLKISPANMSDNSWSFDGVAIPLIRF